MNKGVFSLPSFRNFILLVLLVATIIVMAIILATVLEYNKDAMIDYPETPASWRETSREDDLIRGFCLTGYGYGCGSIRVEYATDKSAEDALSEILEKLQNSMWEIARISPQENRIQFTARRSSRVIVVTTLENKASIKYEHYTDFRVPRD